MRISPQVRSAGHHRRPTRIGSSSLGAVGLLCLCQCTGSISGDPSGSSSPSPKPTPNDDTPALPASGFKPAAAALRKLTLAQYRNSVRDVLGSEIVVPTNLEPDTRVSGYSAIAAAQQTISPSAAEKLEAAAYDVAAQAMTEPLRSRLVPCQPAATVDASCTRQALQSIGTRAFRRLLTDIELERYVGLAAAAATTLGDFYKGMEFGIAALLQSLPFLYRVEVGEPDPQNPALRRFTSSEVASRLSYLVWNTTPDAELLAKVTAAAELSSEELSVQVTRLLRSPRAEEGVATFHAERFSLTALDELVKDQEEYPQATQSLGLAMQQEVQHLVRDLVFRRQGDYRQLLTGQSTFVNAELGALYGLPASGPDFTAASFPADSPRSGLLTTAAFLATYAGASETSPTKRGKFVRETIMCQSIPVPPPEVVTVLPPDPTKRTMREKLAAHAVEPSCAGCHKAMDPIGLAFEHFDTIGRHRADDHGAPLDVTGDLDGIAFSDARQLTELLAQSPIAAECAVRNLYRYATGHIETDGEEPAITKLTEAFAASGYRFDELIKALVVAPELRFAAQP